MIEVRNLTKRYGRITALDDVSFDVARGEIVGFLGPNGAGKTTAMRILSTFMPASGGTARIAGLDVFSESLAVRSRIGYLPENAPLYEDMRVIEYLTFRGRLRGLSGRTLRRRLHECMGVCDLEGVRDRIIRRLSKGFRQRVGLADSLIHSPELLILDEPTIGLDPNQRRQIREFIRGLKQRHTVLLSTHILSEVEAICDRVLIIQGGRIVAADRTDHLMELMKGGRRVVMEIKAPAEAVEPLILKVAGVLAVSREDNADWVRFRCTCERGVDVRPGLAALVAQEGWMLRELQVEKANLEDVFLELTS
jgi:ABC-2 type transport system ATP-binding protein